MKRSFGSNDWMNGRCMWKEPPTCNHIARVRNWTFPMLKNKGCTGKQSPLCMSRLKIPETKHTCLCACCAQSICLHLAGCKGPLLQHALIWTLCKICWCVDRILMVWWLMNHCGVLSKTSVSIAYLLTYEQNHSMWLVDILFDHFILLQYQQKQCVRFQCFPCVQISTWNTIVAIPTSVNCPNHRTVQCVNTLLRYRTKLYIHFEFQ